MHCFMISICDAESEFNNGTNERYHLLNRHMKLEQLKNIEYEKLLLLKSPQNTKNSIKYYCYCEKRKSNLTYARSIFR